MTEQRAGALVISLDFELQWGVRDHYRSDSPYRANILGARRVIPQLLDLFEEFGIAATWATVGFLFAESRAELLEFAPALRPAYPRPELDPYAELIGEDEDADPLHFAPSLLAQIRCRPGQEIGCHTFSHFYCQEEGASAPALRADLESAVALAARRGIQLESIVFPRNQVTGEALDVLRALGFGTYRGAESGWMYRTSPALRNQPHRRLGRLIDQHRVPFSRLVSWDQVWSGRQLANVPGSQFFRPFGPARPRLDQFRLRRMKRALVQAAQCGKIFHLWWHPHNFGRYPEHNLAALRSLLETWSECRDRYGFRSLSMAGAAAAARGESEPSILAGSAGSGQTLAGYSVS